MPPSRRDLLRAAAASALLPSARAAEPDRPRVEDGVLVGDVTTDGAVVWSRTDRPARLWVEWQVEGQPPVRVRGPFASETRDHTAQVELKGLPADSVVSVAARFEDLRTGAMSEPATARFRTAPASLRDVQLVWSADLGGQGWGSDPERGGYRIFDTMRQRDPDFFLLVGDRIYADGPLAPEVVLPDGSIWHNRTSEATSHVAETVDDFRGWYRYHQQDAAWRRFCAEVPLVGQWDDHEVVDNQAPGAWLQDERYSVRDVDTLMLRGRQAWGEYTPMRPFPFDWARMYRHLSYGPLLDLFVLDGRSYRYENNANVQLYPQPTSAWLGREQLDWLKRSLLRSRGTWKVISTAQPLSMLIWHDWSTRTGFDGVANGPGEPLGREHELDDLLRFLWKHDLRNVVFLSADVHFTAAVRFDPARASQRRFHPFWEFVTGPLHAGCFGPCELDPTFGPEVVFQRHAPEGQLGIGPWSPYQFFGELSVAGTSGTLTVRLFDVEGSLLHTEVLAPVSRVEEG